MRPQLRIRALVTLELLGYVCLASGMTDALRFRTSRRKGDLMGAIRTGRLIRTGVFVLFLGLLPASVLAQPLAVHCQVDRTIGDGGALKPYPLQRWCTGMVRLGNLSGGTTDRFVSCRLGKTSYDCQTSIETDGWTPLEVHVASEITEYDITRLGCTYHIGYPEARLLAPLPPSGGPPTVSIAHRYACRQ
jgi:hypothetical protein